MSSALRILWLAMLAGSFALVSCADYEDDDSPQYGGPCAAKEAECGPGASCVYDAHGAPVCACDAGFEGDGTTCVDIDECDAGLYCDPRAACENETGSFKCECPEGWVDVPLDESRARVCVVADECAVALGGCLGNTHCDTSSGVPMCVCDAGYRTEATECRLAEPVGAGERHGCAIDPVDGAVWCWGHAGPGGIDLGAPRRMGDLAGFVHLSQDGTCAFQRDGSLWCWWSGLSGAGEQLVVQWHRVGGAGGWVKAAGGWGLRAGGTLWTWDETETPIVPVQFGAEDDWTDVCPGTVATCATKRDGTAWCWADGVEEPVQVGEDEDYLSLSCHAGLTCGLRAGGRADCWWPRLVPATEDGAPTLLAVPFALRVGFDAGAAEPLEDVTEVSVGGTFVCAVRAIGVVACGGTFGDPELRAGDPLIVDSEPWLERIDNTRGWRSVASGARHACGLRYVDPDPNTENDELDVVSCWGSNDAGQLGRESAGTMTPVPVAL